ncbi:aspartate/glutamate racemase family protein [Fulvivirga sp. 29W222]|uniref:Aspartate/glutamate racemase family protein n=1 Tax=Fulvivirga marina TaxID=2494733 RepID=A0A937G0D1_9BACT|nr:amino acid racemase [Fulvivirga marina]MBL6448213.1 aspartate/glutamate racemase family protein [Fulvivirga marina]
MDLEQDNVIGIVGGVGPQAGLAMYDYILRYTKAAKDQDHLSVVLMSFPRHIADRTAFLDDPLRPNPAYNIARVILNLEQAGAKVVGIACNTSYAREIYSVILDELSKMNSQVSLLNMPKETCRYIKSNHLHVRRVGVMSTNGTYRSEVYKHLLEGYGFEVILPDEQFQNDVIHRMIYDENIGLKANPDKVTFDAKQLMREALNYFANAKAEAVILGCTELSLVAPYVTPNDIVLVDSSEVLAKALIRESLANDKAKGTGSPILT